MIRFGKTAAALGALTALTVAALALADRQALKDPRGDVKLSGASKATKARVDILRAAAGHKEGALKHTITLDRGDDFAIPQIQIDTNRDGRYDYKVEGNVGGSGYVLKRKGGDIDAISLERDGDTFTYRFAKDDIGNPRKYRWRATASYCAENGCAKPADRAPNVGFVTHALR